MLPVVSPNTFSAHLQKFCDELSRGEGRVTPAGLLIRGMCDNIELAAEILQKSSVVEDEDSRTFFLLIAGSVYECLKAQAESDGMQ